MGKGKQTKASPNPTQHLWCFYFVCPDLLIAFIKKSFSSLHAACIWQITSTFILRCCPQARSITYTVSSSSRGLLTPTLNMSELLSTHLHSKSKASQSRGRAALFNNSYTRGFVFEEPVSSYREHNHIIWILKLFTIVLHWNKKCHIITKNNNNNNNNLYTH